MVAPPFGYMVVSLHPCGVKFASPMLSRLVRLTARSQWL